MTRWSTFAVLVAAVLAVAGCGGKASGHDAAAARSASNGAPAACVDSWNAPDNYTRSSLGAGAYQQGARWVKFTRDADARCVVAFPTNPDGELAGQFTFVEIQGSWQSYIANPPQGQSSAPPDPNSPAFLNPQGRAATQEAVAQAKKWERAAENSANAHLQADGSAAPA